MKTLLAIIAFFLVMFAISNAVSQNLACVPRPDIIKRLGYKYKETTIGLGIANNGGVLELLTTKTGNTWTILITMPNGISCMVASGEDWQNLPPKDEGKNGV